MIAPLFDHAGATLYLGDCLDVLRQLPDASIDAIVTDPPYGLSFMGKKWDYDVPSVDVWRECLRVLKPGGHLLAFAGTRTQHRMCCRIEDAGFEIRDMIAWVYGSGFPKSLDVSKQLDKIDASETRRERALRFTAWMRSTGLTAARINEITNTCMGSHYTTAGEQPSVATRDLFELLRPHVGEVPEWVERLVDWRTVESENFKRRAVIGHQQMRDTSEVRIAVTASADDYDAGARRAVPITVAATDAARQWSGWGTALKPALEPVTLARKPLIGTVAENVLAHGVGAVNVDGCRVPSGPDHAEKCASVVGLSSNRNGNAYGEWTGERSDSFNAAGRWPANLIHDGHDDVVALFDGAARFFYCAKASKDDRDEGLDGVAAQKRDDGRKDGNPGGDNPRNRGVHARSNCHPTVKPVDLMRYLCRLITPPGGIVLDPFTGSGSTGKAAMLEGFRFVGIEREAQYCEIAARRIRDAQKQPSLLGAL